MNFDHVQLILRRTKYSSTATLGRLYIVGMVPHWYTLEDTNRDWDKDGVLDEKKVYGQTCIPFGQYIIKMQQSPHFNKLMPYLQDVPGFTSVMIHPGNTVEDTKGCILLGIDYDDSESDYTVSSSQKAFAQLYAILKVANYITIDIQDGTNEDTLESKTVS